MPGRDQKAFTDCIILPQCRKERCARGGSAPSLAPFDQLTWHAAGGILGNFDAGMPVPCGASTQYNGSNLVVAWLLSHACGCFAFCHTGVSTTPCAVCTHSWL